VYHFPDHILALHDDRRRRLEAEVARASALRQARRRQTRRFARRSSRARAPA